MNETSIDIMVRIGELSCVVNELDFFVSILVIEVVSNRLIQDADLKEILIVIELLQVAVSILDLEVRVLRYTVEPHMLKGIFFDPVIEIDSSCLAICVRLGFELIHFDSVCSYVDFFFWKL